jgi:HAD superfamily hydrolase (TIGR01549 family)
VTRAVLFDVDGTLVDSNYQHALSWFRAFRSVGLTVPIWRLHRSIGMGGDRLVPSVTNEEVERRDGDTIRAREAEEFERLLSEVRPLPGAVELVTWCKNNGFPVAIASSAQEQHLMQFLDLLEIRGVIDDWTSASDVETTKPAPDIFRVALSKIGMSDAITVGDSIWDCIAARDAGLISIGLLSGGTSAAELRDAGAAAVYEDAAELFAHVQDSPLRAP